jgi:hypothetical protein
METGPDVVGVTGSATEAGDGSPPKKAGSTTDGSWFTRPLSGWKCAVGWLLSFGVFIGIIAGAGGPAIGDAWESIYATWAVAHGQFACMYPPHPSTISAFAGPGYPLVSGAISVLAQVGHGAAFPTSAALGHGCSNAIPAMVHWSQTGGAIVPTLRTGYVTWLFLLAGLVWLLRSMGRGRTGWEPTTVIIVACLPPVWLSVERFFHPQDIVAMGFVLAATGCALRSQWIAAGVLIACAAFTQQYALLVALPLLVVAPSRGRWEYVAAAVVTAAVIAGPILALTSGTASHYVFYGSGASSGIGGTVIWETHLHGLILLLVSRILPLLLSLLLALYVVRRLGPAAREPAVLLPLLAVSLSLRLVFEQNIFDYYYLALSVMLVLADVHRGRIRETFLAWIAMVTLVYTEPSIFVWRQFWDQDARRWLPVIVVVVAVLFLLRSLYYHRVGWNVAMWAATIVTALIVWPVSSDPIAHEQPVTWLWQVILVGSGLALAAAPLIHEMRERSRIPLPLESAQPGGREGPIPSRTLP